MYSRQVKPQLRRSNTIAQLPSFQYGQQLHPAFQQIPSGYSPRASHMVPTNATMVRPAQYVMSNRAGSMAPSETNLANIETMSNGLGSTYNIALAHGGHMHTTIPQDAQNSLPRDLDTRRPSQMTEAVLEAARKNSAPNSGTTRVRNRRPAQVSVFGDAKSLMCIFFLFLMIVGLVVIVWKVITSAYVNDVQSRPSNCGSGASQDYRVCSGPTYHPAGT